MVWGSRAGQILRVLFGKCSSCGMWNGAQAASIYSNHLKPALERKWGKKRKFTIVEDGDRKGNYSGKGIDAKASAKIFPITLPPRTPS